MSSACVLSDSATTESSTLTKSRDRRGDANTPVQDDTTDASDRITSAVKKREVSVTCAEDSQSTTEKKMKYLLLLDINGALCHRITRRLMNKEHDCKYKSYYVYKRPGMDQFIDFCDSQIDVFDVYLYTSIMRHNAQGMVNRLMPNAPHYLEKIFDREMNKFVAPKFDNKKKNAKGKASRSPDTVRDLAKIWSLLPQYGPENTILVDDDADKCVEYPGNAIIMPPFVNEEKLEWQPDSTLDKLEAYFVQLSADEPGDVRKYMKETPFEPFEASTDGTDGDSVQSDSDEVGETHVVHKQQDDELEEGEIASGDEVNENLSSIMKKYLQINQRGV